MTHRNLMEREVGECWREIAGSSDAVQRMCNEHAARVPSLDINSRAGQYRHGGANLTLFAHYILRHRMQSDNRVEEQSVSEEAQGTDIGRRTEAVSLVEMGPVSVETKGYNRGLELSFTPRN